TSADGARPVPTGQYTCPMHPQVVQDHPGTCPICGMELVLKRSDTAQANPQLDAAVKTVQLSPEQQGKGNVETVMPHRPQPALTLPAIGEVQAPQDTRRTLTAWQGGRVDHLTLRESGGTIKRGERIMDVYSPELVQAEGEYLIALQAADELGHVDYASAAQGS